MNDRHKFRVWNKQEKRYIIPYNYDIAMSQRGKTFILNGDNKYFKLYKDIVVEFCTGLVDKKSKLICDGDKLTVLYPDTGIELTGIVTWHNYKWVVEFDDCSRLSFDDMVKEQWDIEVTGTIHDKEKIRHET